jgi:GTP pyrophosphokinase
VTAKQIQKKFGEKIAELVVAASFKSQIKDKVKQYQEMFKRTRVGGQQALIIKCADILDNSNYYSLVNNQTDKQLLIDKQKYFLRIAEPRLKKTPLFQELKKRHRVLLKIRR